MPSLDALESRIVALAARDLPLARELLRDVIRVPLHHLDEDPSSGLSNHEGPRLELLHQAIVLLGAVEHPSDVWFDDVGNLVWEVRGDDPRHVIWLDGHSDTVRALRSQWHDKLHGIDPYEGLVDLAAVDEAALRAELGWLPPRDEWAHLVFGRGSADQLAGVVSQVFVTKLLRELRAEGALDGVVVRAIATVAEEDNDGGAPMHLLRSTAPEDLPEVVLITEGTGDARKGALGIYRGQRGRMQIEVTVTGRSAHGSMPWEGVNPLEHGAAIVVEAARRYEARDGFADHAFLGHGTRTASWARLDTPSDCAVPERFVFRFDRRLTVGETAEQAVADVEGLTAVAAARAAGCVVEVGVPVYAQQTWTGATIENPQIYPGWLTPEDHPAVQAMVAAYLAVVTPHVAAGGEGATLRAEPRVDRWIFSTDGVGYPVATGSLAVPPAKGWVDAGAVVHPAMVGIGAGVEQNTHKVGEFADARELQHAIAVLTAFPQRYVAARGG